MASHLAALVVGKGEAFQVQSRSTPKPGPGEILVEVKAIALNPADWIMRDMGLFIPTYPTVIGFDMSGLVLEVGENVPFSPNDDGSGPSYKPGTRVAAYAAAAFKGCDPDYGAFQERCLVPWQHAVPLPSGHISWNEAATLPVAAQVPLSVWDALEIPRTVEANARSSGKEKKEVLLIWGASSSVGTMGVQSARLMKEDQGSPFAAVYATVGAANLNYVEYLGADRVFDHQDPQVADAIVSAAKKDGLIIRHCFLAMGDLAQCQAVLKAFVVTAGDEQKAKIGSAPPLPAEAAEVARVESIFVQPAMTDEGARLAQFRYWMGTWLREKLATSSIKPSPPATIVGQGLEAVNDGLNMLQKGVSCTKLVVEVGK